MTTGVASLSIRDLDVSFGGNVVLDGVSLEFGPGINGLVGPNGAGKTTVFNAVSGYVHPKGGVVTLGDTIVTGRSPASVGKLGVGRTFQAPKLIGDLTVLDNVLLGATRSFRSGHVRELFATPVARREERAARRRAADLLGTFGLGGRATTLAGAISLGSQKIVEIVRALMGEPDVLLLDEPAAGLSAHDVETMVDGIRRAANDGERIVVMIEHDLQLVSRLCTHLAVLNFGRVIAAGPPEDVVREPAVVEAYLGAPRRRREPRTDTDAATPIVVES
jgi:branched-chain amino acid transport system ATP-binding protein